MALCYFYDKPAIYKHLNFLFFKLEDEMYQYIHEITKHAQKKASQYIVKHYYMKEIV